MLFRPGKEIKRFGLGDLVYDEYYGSGVIVGFDERFDEMEVSFKEGCEWLTTHTVRGLVCVSRAKDREPLTTPSQDKP